MQPHGLRDLIAIPLWWRLLFFPLWALAQSYTVMVYREPLGEKIIGTVAVLVVFGIASAMWLGIVVIIAGRFGIRF